MLIKVISHEFFKQLKCTLLKKKFGGMILGKRLIWAEVCLTGLQAGMAYSWAPGILAQMTDGTARISLTSQDQIFVINTMFAFKLIGSILTAYLMEKHGRRITLLVLTTLNLISCVPGFFDSTVVWFCIAQAFHGLFINAYVSVMPIVVGETIEADVRGAVTTLTNVAVTVGSTLMSLLSATDYYIFLGVPAIPTVAMIVLVLAMKETPYFCMMKQGKDEARARFVWLRGYCKEEDLVRMEEHLVISNTNTLSLKGFKELLRRNTRKSLGIVVLFAFLAKVSGYDTVLSLFPTLIPKSSISSSTANLIMSVVSVFSTLGSMVLVDRAGRRPLSFISFLGTGIAFIGAGIWYYYHDQTTNNTSSTLWIILTMYFLSNIFSNFGCQQLYHILIGELFTVDLCGRAAMIVTILTSVSLLLFNQAFLPIKEAVGMDNTMFICGGFNFVGCVCVYMFLPETKGKTLEEIQDEIIQKEATSQQRM